MPLQGDLAYPPPSSSNSSLNAYGSENTSSPIPAGGGDKEAEKSSLHAWHGPTDPEHPTNWPLWKKISTTMMLAAVTFTISLNSAMFEPATQLVGQELGVSREVSVLGTSLYLLVLSP